jgi:hypothetical protein
VHYSPTALIFLVLSPFIAWRIYRRVRRVLGRQRLTRVRPWITLCVFSLIVLLLAVVSVVHPLTLALLAGGVIIGVILGTIGLKLTRFEATPEGLFYTPNAHLGIALSLLIVGRILYRIIFAGSLSGGFGMYQQGSGSAITLSIFGTLAGYYVSYAIGLLRWRYGHEQSAATPEAPPPAAPSP